MSAFWTAVVTILLGGVVAATVQGWYQRGAERRQRMIDAADDFLASAQSQYTDLMQVQIAVFTAGFGKAGGAKPQDVAMDDLNRGKREQEVMVARIQLLFGTRSRTTETARTIFSSTASGLGMVQMAIWHNERVAPQASPPEDDEGISMFTRQFNSSALDLDKALRAFPAIARGDIWGLWLMRKARYEWHVGTKMGTRLVARLRARDSNQQPSG